ncbi:MAG: exodeoxyribonuclease VII small subunit [Alcaligenaceae bacterium]|nr:exodeoxyribonuclease VII small subunit [Alcaligenaceae bacterium]
MEKMTFEEAMKEVEDIVSKMNDKTLPLEESIQAYERGLKLMTLCEQKLAQVEEKIKVFDPKETTEENIADNAAPIRKPLTSQAIDSSESENAFLNPNDEDIPF